MLRDLIARLFRKRKPVEDPDQADPKRIYADAEKMERDLGRRIFEDERSPPKAPE